MQGKALVLLVCWSLCAWGVVRVQGIPILPPSPEEESNDGMSSAHVVYNDEVAHTDERVASPSPVPIDSHTPVLSTSVVAAAAPAANTLRFAETAHQLGTGAVADAATAATATSTAGATTTAGAAFTQSEACFQWSIRESSVKVVDKRDSVATWYVPDQDKIFIYGGCSDVSGPHLDRCTTKLEVYDVKLRQWERQDIVVEEQSRPYLGAKGAAYGWSAQQQVLFGFGGSRDTVAGQRTVNWLEVFFYNRTMSQWQWKRPVVSGDVPRPLSDASMTVFEQPGVKSTALIVMFGIQDTEFTNGVKFVEATAPATDGSLVWKVPTIEGAAPPARCGHSATLANNRIYVFGGYGQTAVFNDLYVLEVSALNAPWRWVRIDAAGSQFAPAPRAYHVAVLVRDSQLLIHGGWDNRQSIVYSDTFTLSLTKHEWVQPPKSLQLGNLALRRRSAGAAAIAGATQVMMFGGCEHITCYNIFTPSLLDLAAVCPDSCVKGTYIPPTPTSEPSCRCSDGFAGKFCDVKLECPNKCSDHGECRNGNCTCALGFGGEDCSARVCPNNCGGPDRGMCSEVDKKCLCKPGRWGLDCLEDVCPFHCLGRGVCAPKKSPSSPNVCACDAGFSGPYCQYCDAGVLGSYRVPAAAGIAAPIIRPDLPQTNSSKQVECFLPYSCPNHCSGNGVCKKKVNPDGSVTGECECRQGFGGSDCSGECVLHCTSKQQGVCQGINACTVKCECREGFRGDGCQETYCARDCSGSTHGVCRGGQCACLRPWGGAACEIDISCSNRGEFDGTKCQCKPGFGGVDCSISITCPSDCSGNGACIAMDSPPPGKENVGICKCDPKWTGATCNQRQCHLGCSANGVCQADGSCACFSGYHGQGCERMLQCANNCTATHGMCVAANPRDPLSDLGVCECKEGWKGADCSEIGCHADCFKNGACVEGKCVCYRGFSGRFCEIECPRQCSNNGVCLNGLCTCQPGFMGEDCNSTTVCPGKDLPRGECSGHGDCFRPWGRCYCEPGYTGADCSKEATCGTGCGQNGQCHYGKCVCDLGYEGAHCETKSVCVSNCNNRGYCYNGQCYCNLGYEGDACERFTNDTSCPNACNGNGICQYGRCFCALGFAGADCSVETLRSNCQSSDGQICSNKGLCKYGKCNCFPGSSGARCEEPEKCATGCVTGQGICLLGECRCLPGFKGPDCSEEEVCPGVIPCSGKGICIQEKCACLPGYTGEACDRTDQAIVKQYGDCPNKCSNNGKCHLGQCFCVDGYDGPDCSLKVQDACPDGCSGHGACRFGECFCNPGYVGQACEKEVKCSNKCLDNGVCAYGHCFCPVGYTGPDCDIRVNIEEIERDITRDILEGQRVWKDYFESHNLTIATQARLGTGDCASGCGNLGICLNGQCACQPPFYGTYCQYVRPVSALIDRCPSHCSNNGVCVYGRCHCHLGFTGPTCAVRAPIPCPKDCSGNGICHLGKCNCYLGYTGAACDAKKGCDDDCERYGHGQCNQGVCQCAQGYTGAACNITATATASANGTQTTDLARMKFRETAGSPAAADGAPLPLGKCAVDCGAQGVCVDGSCFCKAGYTGDDCSKSLQELENTRLQEQIMSQADLNALSASASLGDRPAASTSFTVSYLLTALVGFGAGAMAVVIVQFILDRQKERQKNKKANDLLKPLLHSIDHPNKL